MLYYTHTHTHTFARVISVKSTFVLTTNSTLHYILCSITLQKVSSVYIHFWEWASLHITAGSFVYDTTWHQLSKPCWTHATINRIVQMLVHSSGLLQMASQKWNALHHSKKCIHACKVVLLQKWYCITYVWTYYISTARAVYHTYDLLVDRLWEMAFTKLISDQHVCLWYLVNS